jgi:hypothetical protein
MATQAQPQAQQAKMGSSSLEELKKRIYSRSINLSSASEIFKDVDEAARRATNDNQDIEFMNFVVLLFDRLFGEAVTACKDIPEGWQSIRYGGWLSDIAAFGNASGGLLRELPDVRQFGIQKFDTRTETLYKEILRALDRDGNTMNVLRQGRLFVTPLDFLTNRMRWLTSKSSNDAYWYGFVQHNSHVHDALVQWIEKRDVGNIIDGNIRLPPMEYFLMCMVRYPFIQLTPKESSAVPKALQDTVFVRPVATDFSYKSRTKVPLTPFTVVLQKYIRDLFPHNSSGFMSSESKLFLCMVAEYWVGCGLIIRKDHAKFEQKIMQIQSGSSSVDSFGQHDHPSPTDVVFMNDAHRPSWTQMTLESTYLLFWHLLADPAVSTFFRGVDQSQNDFDADKTEEIGLTTAPLSFLQQPLFDMLRVYFSGEKQNNLMLVVDIWLLYLQPWSLKHSQDAGPDRVRCVDDAYTKEWKYYVAANLHIYTTLLTCFLRFVSRMCHNWDTLDSGSGTAAIDGHIVFNALLKVLKVLSFKPLRQDILSLQEDARNRYSTCSRNIQQQQRMQMIESDIPFISPRITARNSPGRSRKFSTEAHTGDIFISGVIRQHQLLFPDSKIDDLPNMGLGDAVSDNKEYADRIIRMLHTLHAKADVGYLSYVWQLLADCGAEIGKIL